MKTILTETQKSDLEKQHRSERDGKVRDRIKAVLLHSEGWTQGHIAQTLRLHESTVWDHLNEYETINGSATIAFLEKVLEVYPSAKTIHIIADGGRAHTSEEVDLFLLKSNAVNKTYLKEKYSIELPSNTVKLTKKMKKELEKVLEKKPELFLNHSVLEIKDLTAIELLKTLRKYPPHPKIVMHILPHYSPNLNPIERVWKIANEHVRNNVVFASFDDFKEKMHNFFDVIWDTISDEVRSRITDNFQTLKPAF